MADALPRQLRALAALVEAVEDGTPAEVQTARPAGVDPDGELVRADVTLVVPVAAVDETVDAVEGDIDSSDQEAAADEVAAPETDPSQDADSTEPSLSDLTDTVRGDVLAVVKHGQEPHRRADDRDVTPAAIHHNLRAAREELGVDDLADVVPAVRTDADGAASAAETAPDESTSEAAEESPEWAVTDGGAAATTAQTGARVACQNCGNTVTRDYARVFSPDGVEGVRTCPDCPDLIREGDGTVRKKRSGPHAVSREEVQDGDD